MHTRTRLRLEIFKVTVPKLQQLKIEKKKNSLFLPLLLSDFDDFGHLLTYVITRVWFSACHFLSIFRKNFIHFLFHFYLFLRIFWWNDPQVTDSIDISHFSSDSSVSVIFKWNLPLSFSLPFQLVFFIGIDEITSHTHKRVKKVKFVKWIEKWADRGK